MLVSLLPGGRRTAAPRMPARLGTASAARAPQRCVVGSSSRMSSLRTTRSALLPTSMRSRLVLEEVGVGAVDGEALDHLLDRDPLLRPEGVHVRVSGLRRRAQDAVPDAADRVGRGDDRVVAGRRDLDAARPTGFAWGTRGRPGADRGTAPGPLGTCRPWRTSTAAAARPRRARPCAGCRRGRRAAGG